MSSPNGHFYLWYARSALGCFTCSQGWEAQNWGRLNPVEVVVTAVRVGAWKRNRNGIMPAWKLWKIRKLHCSGSWWGHPSRAGLKSHWVREEKAQGWRSWAQRSPWRQALKGALCPCSAWLPPTGACPAVPCVWGGVPRKHWSTGMLDFSLKCGNALWAIMKILWPWFVCLFLQKMLNKKRDDRKKPQWNLKGNLKQLPEYRGDRVIGQGLSLLLKQMPLSTAKWSCWKEKKKKNWPKL